MSQVICMFRMWLPNMLGHEGTEEVREQSGVWAPLVTSGCHSDTRKFLCSLFSPVCMKGEETHGNKTEGSTPASLSCIIVGRLFVSGYYVTIPPCRSLCATVRDACAPTMNMFGFSWPRMLNCSIFPSITEAGSLCIPPDEDVTSGA